MCILTYLSETLSKKQKRGFFLAFVLIAGISVLEVITLVVDGLPPGYRWLNILDILDVGQGDGIFYRFESGTCIFIDGGSSDRNSLARM